MNYLELLRPVKTYGVRETINRGNDGKTDCTAKCSKNARALKTQHETIRNTDKRSLTRNGRLLCRVTRSSSKELVMIESTQGYHTIIFNLWP